MKIKLIKFTAGSAIDSTPLELQPSSITVFVGPNYSGKSQAIREISTQLQSGKQNRQKLVIDELILDSMTEGEADDEIAAMSVSPRPGEPQTPGYAQFRYRGNQMSLPIMQFRSALLNPNTLSELFAQWYSGQRTLVLNGGNRISLLNDQPGGDLQSDPISSFQILFRDDALRQRLSQIVFRAFGQHLTIDPTNMGSLRMRLSRHQAPSADIEKGLTQQSIDFHRQGTPIAETSDGTRAFTGIICEILAGNPRILLIDEPEAFLHPSLSFLLGQELSTEISRSKKQMFVSTHSPNFIMGCLQSGVDVNIVRFTYRENVATARLMPSADLRTWMRNPLLRSANVLSALFHESVIVSESDADRAFYQEINDRLLKFDNNRGIPNAIFLNAQNKQTIPTIISPLRKMGIPAAAIYDLDLIKDGGGVATSFLASAGVPEIARQSINTLRTSVLKALEQASVDFKKNGGINILDAGNKEAAQSLLDQLAAYGAFLVPTGELESWLKNFGVTGHGPAWLISMFEKLGDDPEDPSYVQPEGNDVWLFLEKVRGWLFDPTRKGIPS